MSNCVMDVVTNNKYLLFANNYKHPKMSTTLKVVKRIFDIVFSAGVLITLSPIFLIIALLIKLNSPSSSVFYGHKRLGLDGKLFNCYKFTSMIPNADLILKKWLNENPKLKAEYEKDFKLKNDPRIIPVIGEFLRKTSLDELPQFFNVFKGEMSVVGPRPIVEEELELYGKHGKCFLSIKPGITGLWQVSGRNDVSYEIRVAMDVYYVCKQNFLSDVEIIYKTILTMFLKKGAY